MANKKKYYAVAEGRGKLPYIYDTWNDCKDAVEKFKGAKYKSFSTIQEAIKYLADDVGLTSEALIKKCSYLPKNVKKINTVTKKQTISTKKIDIKISNLHDSNILKIYVDGSFSKEKMNYSYGFVAVLNDHILCTSNDIGKDPGAIPLRNVSGEMTGAMKAVEFAKNNNYTSLVIYYDYKGIEDWAVGNWKRNNEYTKAYHTFMQVHMKSMKIDFVKVKAHTGDKYNEIADQLAKDAFKKIPTHISNIVIPKKQNEEIKEIKIDELKYLNGLSAETKKWTKGIIENNKPNLYHSIAATIGYFKNKIVDQEMIDKYYKKHSTTRTYLVENMDKLEELFYYVNRRIKK
ncbi:ribonuclease H family protein [Lutibacter sp. B2]|nr:ribonuclease H family protein [Lutibacter sp. B2]